MSEFEKLLQKQDGNVTYVDFSPDVDDLEFDWSIMMDRASTAIEEQTDVIYEQHALIEELMKKQTPAAPSPWWIVSGILSVFLFGFTIATVV